MIYKRYLFKEISKTFFAVLSGIFFGSCFLLSFSQFKSFSEAAMPMGDVLIFNLASFCLLLSIYVPISLLIATVKVYSSLNQRFELLALISCGLSPKKIISPFILFACLVMSFLYLSAQFLTPQAELWLKHFKSSSYNAYLQKCVHHFCNPSDDTDVLYATYDVKTHTLHDTYWIENPHKIWHFKSLDLNQHVGYYVDTLENKGQGWILTCSVPNLKNIPIQISKQHLKNEYLPLKAQSLSALSRYISLKLSTIPNKAAMATARFLLVATLPLSCLFAVILTAPLCFTFSRSLNVFIIFAVSLLIGACYLAVCNFSYILGSNQLIPPVVALLIPPIALSIGSIICYDRL